MSRSSEIEDSELLAAGIDRDEVERQLALFRDPPGYADLVRSCAVGDGIELLEDTEACLEAYDRARAAGRLSKFVPASGAASRMFQALQALGASVRSRAQLESLAAEGDARARLVTEFLDGVDRFAFSAALRDRMRAAGDDLDSAASAGDLEPIVRALVSSDGLGYASLPKGLIPFHAVEGGSRTAFEEHLHEAADLVRDDGGRVRLHFTVSDEHLGLFQAKLGEVRATIETGGTKLLVGFSTQARRTDTIAVGLDDEPFRDTAGRLLFRPGGHGALLDNLNRSGADIALIQNIDNVQPAARRSASNQWKKRLIGRLVLLQELIGKAQAGGDLDAADSQRLLELTPAASNGGMAAALERPLRVCGVVRNSGEPGGGPFWVRDGEGRVTKQIVEGAQVDPDSAEQQEIFRGASHFNPVLLVCGLRRSDGAPFDLNQYVDPRAVFISRKSYEGRDLKALERPGLWNGAMAHWLTGFAEVDQATFTPVKTVVDLLRPEHQSERG